VHYRDRAFVCPICVMRGGDPNYISQDIIGHLAYRHSDPNYRPPGAGKNWW